MVWGKRVIIEPAARGGREVMWGGGGERRDAGGVNATPPFGLKEIFFYFRDVDEGNGIRRRRRLTLLYSYILA